MTAPAAQLLPDIPAAQYHADQFGDVPTLSRGCAHVLVTQTPAHARLTHPRLGAQTVKTNKAMDLGSVVHELILGVGGGIAVAPFDSWRTNDSKAFREDAEAQGKTPILQAHFEDAVASAAGIRKQLAERGLGNVFAKGINEATILFNDNGTLCRTRIDNLDLEPDLHRACIWDLKTCEDAGLEAIERKIGSMGYALQASFNRRGVELLYPDMRGRIEFVLVFAEINPPYAVQPVRLSGAWREIGDAQYRKALAIWSRCLAEDRWPAYEGEIPFAEPRSWDMKVLEQ